MRTLAALAALILLAVAPGRALAINANALDGVWKGAYICGQGPTGLTLTLDGDANGNVTGVFEFWPKPNNPYVASGSFRIAGSVDSNQVFTLTGVQWISQPYGYSMVGLRGKMYLGKNAGDPLTLFGTVFGVAGCDQFYADKQ